MQNFMKLRNQSELGGRFKGCTGISHGTGQLAYPDGSSSKGGDLFGESFVCVKEVYRFV